MDNKLSVFQDVSNPIWQFLAVFQIFCEKHQINSPYIEEEAGDNQDKLTLFRKKIQVFKQVLNQQYSKIQVQMSFFDEYETILNNQQFLLMNLNKQIVQDKLEIAKLKKIHCQSFQRRDCPDEPLKMTLFEQFEQEMMEQKE